MYVPMDENVASSCGYKWAPYLSFNASLSKEKVGTFDTELFHEEFLEQ